MNIVYGLACLAVLTGWGRFRKHRRLESEVLLVSVYVNKFEIFFTWDSKDIRQKKSNESQEDLKFQESLYGFAFTSIFYTHQLRVVGMVCQVRCRVYPGQVTSQEIDDTPIVSLK